MIFERHGLARGETSVDPRLHAALYRWTLIFLLLWAPTAVLVGYLARDIRLDQTSPGWMSMVLFQLLTLIFLGTAASDILVRISKPALSVLYLRKFHAEPRQAFPINPFSNDSGLPKNSPRRGEPFRLASMLEGIGLVGVRVLALRDARTPGSGHMIFYIVPVVLMLMLFAPPMLLLFASWAAALGAIEALGLGSDYADLAVPIVFAAYIAVFVLWPRARFWLRESMETHAERVRNLLIPGRRPRDLAQLDRVIAHARSVGPIAVRSSDENWIAFVERLLGAVDATIFDLRASSENCEIELGLIQRLGLQDRVIWLVNDDAAIARTESGYRIAATEFHGAPNILVAAAQMPKTRFWHGLPPGQLMFVTTLLARLQRR
jgi:hypothetical protein